MFTITHVLSVESCRLQHSGGLSAANIEVYEADARYFHHPCESNMNCPLLECKHRRQGLLKGNLLTLKGDIVALYCLA